MAEAPRQVFGVERLGALSDGVIAIAMTLLVLELKIPPALEDEGVLDQVRLQLPHFLGWIISFVFISVVWHEQHLVFSQLRGVDTRFILTNLVQLAAVSLIPFGSALVGDFATAPTAVIIFSAIMVFNSVAMAANAACLARSAHLHARPEATTFIYRGLFHLAVGVTAAVLATAMAHVHHPLAGAATWIIVPLLVAVYHVDGHGRLVRLLQPPPRG